VLRHFLLSESGPESRPKLEMGQPVTLEFIGALLKLNLKERRRSTRLDSHCSKRA